LEHRACREFPHVVVERIDERARTPQMPPFRVYGHTCQIPRVAFPWGLRIGDEEPSLLFVNPAGTGFEGYLSHEPAPSVPVLAGFAHAWKDTGIRVSRVGERACAR
jgi:hypothetical protein